LPQGFVLKKSGNKDVRGDDVLIEDVIDEQRELLKSSGTKITKDVFFKWKEDRLKRKELDKK
jgi:hypothetical protein